MKNMKHIKLFEGFESIKLSKTLGYAKERKSDFLDHIKRTCDSLNFPYSQLSDEYFDYLPFNAALRKADILTDEPCDARGIDSFESRYVIEGENCKKGKVKRKWGRSVRTVTCAVCNGTGIKPKKGEPKMIKFWFTKEGKFVTTTCVDGLVRDRNRAGDKVPQGRSKYTHTRVKRINHFDSDWRDRLQELQVGQYVLLRTRGRESYGVVCTESNYWDRNRNKVFIVQSTRGFDGDYPDRNTQINGEKWRSYGSHAWRVDDGEFEWIKPVSIKKADDALDAKPDPYEWNSGFAFSWSGIRSTGRDIENEIKDAHFALVLDFSKLKKSEFKTRTTIKHEREESREGALALVSDKEIKSQNIKRYIDELSKRMEVDENLGNVDKIILKLVGQNSFFFVRKGYVKSGLERILNGYLEMMRATDKQYYIDNLNQNIKRSYKDYMNVNKEVNRNIEEIIKKLETDKPDKYEKYLEILSLMKELSLAIYENVKSFKVENIEDIEILYQRLLSMKNLLTSGRYNLDNLRYFTDYLNRSSIDYPYRYLTDHYYMGNPDEVIEGAKKVISIIKRM